MNDKNYSFLPESIKNAVWKYCYARESLTTYILNDSYNEKKGTDRNARFSALAVIALTIATTTTDTLKKVLADYANNYLNDWNLFFAVLVTSFSAMSAVASFAIRHYLECTIKNSNNLSELKRARFELMFCEPEILELRPDEYDRKLTIFNNKIERIVDQINELSCKERINISNEFYSSDVDENNLKRKTVYNHCNSLLDDIIYRYFNNRKADNGQ